MTTGSAPDIIDRVLRTARGTPDAVAVIDDTRRVTYAELARQARRIAGGLGAGPGTVGVLVRRSAGTVAALLGVLAAGAAYCPIDPAFPPERRAALLGAAGCVDVIDPEDPPAGAPATVVAPDPAAPAYVLFTSGSTGLPKPVVTPRGAIASAVASLGDLMGVVAGDRVLQFASLNWDTCLEEILPALTRGATLVFDDDAYSGSFPRFVRMLDRHRIGVLDLPTAFWHEFVRYLGEDGNPVPRSVREIVIGGEAASPARLEDWRALPGAERIRLVNTYGCTETTLVTHAIDVHGPHAGPYEGRAVPIGRALPHVRELIGENGELLVGGPSLALGYRGLPEATAERFVTVEAYRYFRTGDRVQREADGMLVHRGRLDDDIKVRGIRVSPGEVEAHLCAHPDVAGAAATGTVVGDHTAVIAYVTARRHADADALPADLLRHLREHSPRHLVPARIVVVPELALRPNGKVDRRRTHSLYSIAN